MRNDMNNAAEKIPPLEFNTYDFYGKITEKVKIAFIADFHDRTYTRIMASFKDKKPDMIVIAGDLISWNTIRQTDMTLRRYIEMLARHEIYVEECGHLYTSHYAFDFLKRCTETAPTFYSLGNHEKYFDEEDRKCVEEAGAVLLDNCYTVHRNIAIGGLTSAHVRNMGRPYRTSSGREKVSTRPVSRALSEEAVGWLTDFDSFDGFKLLLCHHPEYYDRYLADTGIDLILAGHAHGGQIRIGKRGLYAPGQGLFPGYVSGFYHDRMLVSRGIANVSMLIPRINNIREVIYINLIPYGK